MFSVCVRIYECSAYKTLLHTMMETLPVVWTNHVTSPSVGMLLHDLPNQRLFLSLSLVCTESWQNSLEKFKEKAYDISDDTKVRTHRQAGSKWRLLLSVSQSVGLIMESGGEAKLVADSIPGPLVF